MNAPFDVSLIAPVAIGTLVAWRIYARMRRLIGRQRLTIVRPWISVIVFPLILLMLLSTTLFQPEGTAVAAASAVGAAIGVGLGRYGTHLTKFEATPAGLFYTPNAHLGIALTLLLLVRIAYRVAHLYIGGRGSDLPSPPMTSTPLTLAIFATLAGYYTTYAIGLLRWRASVRPRE